MIFLASSLLPFPVAFVFWLLYSAGRLAASQAIVTRIITLPHGQVITVQVPASEPVETTLRRVIR